MKMTVLGVKRARGVSGKTGAPFDFCQLFVMVPVEVGGNPDKYASSGYGYELAEMPMAADALEKFSGVKFPATLELTTDVAPRFGKLETVVTGFVPVLARATSNG